MMAKRRKTVTDEDRALWKAVASTVTPLRQEKQSLLRQSMERLAEQDLAGPASKSIKPVWTTGLPGEAGQKHPLKRPSAKGASPAGPAPHHPIDRTTSKKIAKGKQAIDARLDLHGMTQERARATLLSFLQMAHAMDHRIVLVITGKGRQGGGILRQRVPDWLHQPQFAELANGYQEAHASHGGSGALYIRIRRRKKLR